MTQTQQTQKVKALIDGIILLNKPAGITSNLALQKVKRLFNAKKAGHTGSLDPFATGMLPICFGEATKFSQYLLNSDKCYYAKVKLGIKTTTADLTGDILQERETLPLERIKLEQILTTFKGEIQQIPSMYSALKHQGQPLYKYARAGKEIERQARTVTIKNLELLEYSHPAFTIKVTCSKGTYIRNLAEDIGEAIGVGAHVTSLHRLYTAGLETEKMFTLEELENFNLLQLMQCVLPADRAIMDFPKLNLTASMAKDIRMGRVLRISSDGNKIGTLRLYDETCQLIGLGNLDIMGKLKAERLCALKPS